MPEEKPQTVLEFIASEQPSDDGKRRTQEFVEGSSSTTKLLLAIASAYGGSVRWDSDPVAAKLLTDFAATFAAHEMTTF